MVLEVGISDGGIGEGEIIGVWKDLFTVDATVPPAIALLNLKELNCNTFENFSF